MSTIVAIILFISYLFFGVRFYGAGWWILVMLISAYIDCSFVGKKVERAKNKSEELHQKNQDLNSELAELRQKNRELEAANVNWESNFDRKLDNAIKYYLGERTKF